MTGFFTLLEAGIDVGPFRDELNSVPGAYQIDTRRQKRLPHMRETEAVFLRHQREDAQGSPGAGPGDPTEISARFPQTMAWLDRTVDHLGGTIGRAIFVSLSPLGRVYPHVDGARNPYLTIRDRLQLVISAPAGSLLYVEGECQTLREGELWAFDNNRSHWAENPATLPRVHLIFDVLPAIAGGGFYTPVSGAG